MANGFLLHENGVAICTHCLTRAADALKGKAHKTHDTWMHAAWVRATDLVDTLWETMNPCERAVVLKPDAQAVLRWCTEYGLQRLESLRGEDK